MPLDIGTHLGPYEILSFLGAGGMGEVYQARDARLNRLVALKIVPPGLVADDGRRRRFMQEAQLASSLQHPHIVTIFDIGTSNGIDYLAMELVRGRPLDSVIPNKGLRLNDALRYGVQIADALSAAHEAGIVHRDLKPGNIMVTDQDQIKVLDFGLATLTASGMAGDLDETRVEAAAVRTGAGTVLGTVAYMSPEQAEGKKVDGRSDIFSFGAILYEMLSGQRAFRADSTPATLAAVINLEPEPLAKKVEGMPQPVERLVSRCLRKDLGRRAQHASDIKVALEELQEESTSGALHAATPPARTQGVRRWAVPAMAVVLVIALLGAAAALWSRAPAARTVSTPVPLTALPGSEAFPTFSPDGRQVAFVQQSASAPPDVYVQLIASGGNRLRLTDDGHGHRLPSWSPDGTSIALWHSESRAGPFSLKIISPLGGPERHVLDWTGAAGRIAWSPDGQSIAISPVGTRVSADRGITLISLSSGEQIEWAALDEVYRGSAEPAFSPDGRAMAYLRTTGDNTGELHVVSVGADGRPAGPPRRLPDAGGEAQAPLWTVDGREILFIHGSPTSNGGISRIRADGSGEPERIAGLDGATTFAVSPDGTKLAFSRGGNNGEIWRQDLQDPAQSGPLAPSTLWDGGAEYSPDGQRVAFSSNRGGSREIWVAEASGDHAQSLTSFGGPVGGTPRWSPDSRQIAFDSRPDGNSDIFVVPAGGGAVRQLTREPGEDARPAWSHDGRWIYFSSDRSGRSEIWRIPGGGGDAAQITREGGAAVLAAPDGQRLFYKRVDQDFAGSIFAVAPDGSRDTELVEENVLFMTYATTPTGLWFVSVPTDARPYWAVQVLRFANGNVDEAARLGFRPDNLNMSVSPDERYVLLAKPDQSGTDLLLVNDFR